MPTLTPSVGFYLEGLSLLNTYLDIVLRFCRLFKESFYVMETSRFESWLACA